MKMGRWTGWRFSKFEIDPEDINILETHLSHPRMRDEQTRA